MRTNSYKWGVIVDCLWAPVRVKPNNDSKIIFELPALTDVQVNLKKSIDQFFYILTSSGDEGYCSKEFVVLKK